MPVINVLRKLKRTEQEGWKTFFSNNACEKRNLCTADKVCTETAILRVVNDLLAAMDEDKFSVLLLLDLSAAFDTTDHQILLSRLETVFSIRSTALHWF